VRNLPPDVTDQEIINAEKYDEYVKSWPSYKAHPNEEIDKKIKEIGAEYLRNTRKSYYPVSAKEKHLLNQVIGSPKKML